VAPLSYRQWSGVAILGVILGCTATKVALLPTQASLDELAPEGNPGPKAVLNYNGQRVAVDVVHRLEGGQETIDLVLGGETLEREAYERTAHVFALKQADGDEFDPPLPLLSVNDAGAWSGHLVSGGVSHDASATVVVSVSSVKVKPVDMPATLSTVNLELDSGGPRKATRVLKFWMVRGRGVVSREFSMGVKRLPGD